MTLLGCIYYLENKLLKDDFDNYNDVDICCYWKEGPIYQGKLSTFRSSLSCRYDDMYVQDIYQIRDSALSRLNIVCNDIEPLMLTLSALCDIINKSNKCLRL